MDKLKKRIIAIILGIEAGIIIWFILFITLIIYAFTGIVAYLITSILTLNFQTIQTACMIITGIITIGFSILIFWFSVNKNFKLYKFLTIIIPLIMATIYFVFTKHENKIKEISIEKAKYIQDFNKQNSSNYIISKTLFEEKLKECSRRIKPDSTNLYLGIFASQAPIDSIQVDTLIFSPKDQLGLCIFSFKSENSYFAKSIFFERISSTNFKIHSGGNCPQENDKTRQLAIINLEYLLYIDLKQRVHADYNPTYKKWTESVPSVLNKDYWITTIKEDTLNLDIYGYYQTDK